MLEADRLRGVAVDPRLGRVSVEQWCQSWLARRSDLRPTTRRLYAYLLERHVLPTFGTELGRLSVFGVRAWNAALLAREPAIAPKADRVLRAVLNVAVADAIIATNPCKVKGAGQDRSDERPLASIAEVTELADASTHDGMRWCSSPTGAGCGSGNSGHCGGPTWTCSTGGYRSESKSLM